MAFEAGALGAGALNMAASAAGARLQHGDMREFTPCTGFDAVHRLLTLFHGRKIFLPVIPVLFYPPEAFAGNGRPPSGKGILKRRMSAAAGAPEQSVQPSIRCGCNFHLLATARAPRFSTAFRKNAAPGPAPVRHFNLVSFRETATTGCAGESKRLSLSVPGEAGWYSIPKSCST